LSLNSYRLDELQSCRPTPRQGPDIVHIALITSVDEGRVSNDVIPIVEYLHLQQDNYEMRRPKRGDPL
jgi:hypothetical protein